MKEIQDQIFIKAGDLPGDLLGDLPGDGDFFFLPGDFPSLATANKINRRDTSCYSIGFGGCADGGCYKDMGGTGYCTNMGSRILPNCQCVYGKRLLKLILLAQEKFYSKLITKNF